MRAVHGAAQIVYHSDRLHQSDLFHVSDRLDHRPPAAHHRPPTPLEQSVPRVLRRTTIRALVAVATAAVAATTLAACGGSSGGSSGGDSISLIGYSVPKPAYDALEEAFQKTDQGKGVTFKASYGASGDQSRAVANGQQADYVNFSIGPDMTRLVPKQVDASWDAGANKGIVADTVVVLVVRKGNPLGIHGWDDLVKSGVKVVTPDPGSSGSAKWNILAAYAHGAANGGDTAGVDFVSQLAKNIVSKPASGSAATQTFLNGTGDVLISYEAEAIATRAKGQDVDYVIPDDTLSIETPGAVTKTANQAAKDFLTYCLSDDGQKVFGANGFRPMNGVAPGDVKGANDSSNPYPAVGTLHTIDELGGWDKLNALFDPDSSTLTKALGGSS